ncbi:MAG: tetratricopeptide repeat protein [Desulfovibrionaceae bacterium]
MPDRIPFAVAFAPALAAFEAGDLPQAARLCAGLLDTHGPHPDAIKLLALVSSGLGRHADAAALFQKVLAMAPHAPDAAATRHNLGQTFLELHRLDDAAAAFRAAIAQDPAMADAYLGLGATLQRLGSNREALGCLRRALTLDPTLEEAHHALIVSLYYEPDQTPATILRAATDWDAAMARPRATARAARSAHAPRPPRPPRSETPGRPLRVALVSPDLRRHPVGFFADALFRCHDREAFTLLCYSDAAREDDYSARFAAQCAAWTRTAHLSHAALAERLRTDRVDIVLDLAGHTRGNRLLALAERCAPVQACWGGFFGTTGLGAMDYLVTDPMETPPGSDTWYTETLARLPHDYICYTPPPDMPAPGPPPALATGHLTFGCFNNQAKLNPATAALWARALAAAPGSRLLLKNASLASPAVAARTRGLFDRHGVAAHRLELRSGSPHRDLLATYNEVDVALDPTPYSGGLTTCEALCMGVPVLTLPGDTFASRHSAAHLAAAGLGHWIAASADSFAALAGRAARDLDRLAAERAALPEAVRTSPLCDGARHTRYLEAALRIMWRQHLDGKKEPFSVPA